MTAVLRRQPRLLKTPSHHRLSHRRQCPRSQNQEQILAQRLSMGHSRQRKLETCQEAQISSRKISVWQPQHQKPLKTQWRDPLSLHLSSLEPKGNIDNLTRWTLVRKSVKRLKLPSRRDQQPKMALFQVQNYQMQHRSQLSSHQLMRPKNNDSLMKPLSLVDCNKFTIQH